MAISLSDLPPAYQKQAAEKMREAERKRQGAVKPQETKYHSRPDTRATESGAALHFDSRKEARRYDELVALFRAGKIKDLRLQVDFTLQEAYTCIDGKRVRAIRYRADFTYQEQVNGEWDVVVEDVKGKKTKEYNIKKKLMLDRYGIRIRET